MDRIVINMKKIILLLGTVCLSTSISAKTTPVIFDTDMGNDIDDALALSMLYRYMDEGTIDLIGITSCKTDPSSVQFIDILNNYYGYPSIPIGKLTGAEQYKRLNTYAEKMVARGQWKGSVTDYDALPESVDLMRTLLMGQKDHSVVIVAVGFFTNLARLLESDPELVKSKVKTLVLMAGDFREQDRTNEHNVVWDIPAAQKVCAEWPSEIVTSPFLVGEEVLFPVDAILENLKYDTPNPVAEAYKNYKRMPYNRPSWDLSAVLYAIEPKAGYFTLSPKGTFEVTDEGATILHPSRKGQHRYMNVASGKNSEILKRYLTLTSSRP